MIILFHWTLGSARWPLSTNKKLNVKTRKMSHSTPSSPGWPTGFFFFFSDQLLVVTGARRNEFYSNRLLRTCVCVTLTTNSIQLATTTWPKTSHRRGWFHSSTFSLSALCSHKNKNKSLNKYKKNKKKERQVVAGLWIVYVISTRCWAGHHQQMTSSQSPSSSNQATTRHTAATDVWKVAR